MKEKTVINDLTHGPIGRQILLFCLPIMLSNVLDTLYNLVDMAIVGQFVGSVGLSAVSTSGQITILLYCMGIGFATGGQILISQQVGVGDRRGVRITIGTSISFTVILGISVAVIGLLLHQPLLRMVNTPSEAMQDANEYMVWCCLGVPFTYFYAGMTALLRGMGDSKHPLLFTTASAVTNIVLDLVLVAGFGLRAKGAAIATSFAQMMGCVCCVIYLYKNRDAIGFDFRKESFRMEKNTLGRIVKLAAPIAVQVVAINVSMLFVNARVNSYGVVASAVNGIGSKLYSMVTIVTNATQSAVATFTGQNVAAGQHSRVRRMMGYATGINMAFWLISVLACTVLPRAIFSIFTTESEVLALAPDYMHIMILMYLTFALLSIPCGFINGVGNVGLNLVIAILDGVVARIGLGLLIAVSMGVGLYGYWWGNALAGLVSVFGGWGYYFTGRWKKRERLTDGL